MDGPLYVLHFAQKFQVRFKLICYRDCSLQGPHEVAGQAFLALPSKRMNISKNVIKYF